MVPLSMCIYDIYDLLLFGIGLADALYIHCTALVRSSPFTCNTLCSLPIYVGQSYIACHKD